MKSNITQEVHSEKLSFSRSEKLFEDCSVIGANFIRISVVVDGDTLKIGDDTCRLNGIDAPEAGQKCKSAGGKELPCGNQATARLRQLAEGRQTS